MIYYFKIIAGEIKQSWWVLVFMICCYMLYEHGMRVHAQQYDKFSSLLNHLRSEQQLAIKLQETLLLQINSQSDPAWVELTLMKGLGLVPEGQAKIYFTHQRK